MDSDVYHFERAEKKSRRKGAVLSWLLLPVLLWNLPGCTPRELTARQRAADVDWMISLIRDNYPFLTTKERSEGYDWLAQADAFRQAAVGARNNKEFVKVIRRSLLSLTDRHTDIANGQVLGRPTQSGITVPSVDGWAARRTADYWYNLACEDEGMQPSIDAVYSCGRYIVAGLCPTFPSACTVALGSIVEKVDGVPVDTYVLSLRGEEALRYDTIEKKVYMPRLVLPDRMVILTLRCPDGSLRECEIMGTSQGWILPYTPPPRYRSSSVFGKSTETMYSEIIDGSVGYLHIKSMIPMKDTVSFIASFCDSVRDLPAVIVDIRGNTGGDDGVWQTLVKRMISREYSFQHAFCLRASELLSPLWDYLEFNFPEHIVDKRSLPVTAPTELGTSAFHPPVANTQSLSPDRETICYGGRVFLLTDSRTFSAAENFAAFCKSTHWATIVGEPTGGGGLGLVPCTAQMPNSGVVIRFSSSMGLNPDYTSNAECPTTPDYLVSQSLDDILRSVRQPASITGSLDIDNDAVLRFCLELIHESTER